METEEKFTCQGCGCTIDTGLRHADKPEYCVLCYLNDEDRAAITAIVEKVHLDYAKIYGPGPCGRWEQLVKGQWMPVTA